MTGYRTIIAAVDFADSVDHVVERAAELARHDRARLHLLHVVESLPPIVVGDEPVPPVNTGIDEGELSKQARGRLRDIVARLDLEDCDVHVVTGTPKFEIIELANALAADLIVLGSHGRHGISRLLGSTASAILHHAPCDVLAIRLKGQ